MKNNHKQPVHTKKCNYCPQIFDRHEAVCWRCGNCQGCGTLTPDKYGNYCIHCHNWIDQPRYNHRGPTISMEIGHKAPRIEKHKDFGR